MTLSPEDLSTLNATALDIYRRNLDLYLAEPSRLAILYGSHFMDQDLRAQAKVICNTASALTGLPAALVLVAENKAILAAYSNDYLDSAKEEEVAVEASMCKYVVNERRPFSVESATTHALVCYHEAVTGPTGLRAYLGVPIIVKQEAVGSLCIWGTQERTFSGLDVEVLVNLAAVLVALEARRDATA